MKMYLTAFAKYSPKFRPWLKEIIFHFGLPLALFVVVFFFGSSRQVFQNSWDEGINLQWAMLLDKGYALYSEIWMDQPPVFPFILATGFRLLGYKVGVARLVVLFFSSTLIWAAFQYLRSLFDTRTAFIGSLMVMILPAYLGLSASVMQAIPNLAFAMLSLWALALWHKSHRYLWLIFSAIFMGFSILTKLFTGLLVPIFILGIIMDGYARVPDKKQWYRCLNGVMIWGIFFGSILLAAGIFVVGLENLGQLFGTHLTDGFASEKQQNLTLASQLRNSYPFIILGILGAIDLLQRRKWIALYPFVWMVTAYSMLSFYYPIWYHYKLLITIPAALLSANAIVLAVDFLVDLTKKYFETSQVSLKSVLAILSLVGFLAIFFHFPNSLQELRISDVGQDDGFSESENLFLGLMLEYAARTNWVVTDSPLFAFRARLPVPPNLVDISMKRITSGYLSEEEIMDGIQTVRPEQIFLARFQYPQLENFLMDDYILLREKDGMKFYIRRDLE